MAVFSNLVGRFSRNRGSSRGSSLENGIIGMLELTIILHIPIIPAESGGIFGILSNISGGFRRNSQNFIKLWSVH